MTNHVDLLLTPEESDGVSRLIQSPSHWARQKAYRTLFEDEVSDLMLEKSATRSIKHGFWETVILRNKLRNKPGEAFRLNQKVATENQQSIEQA